MKLAVDVSVETKEKLKELAYHLKITQTELLTRLIEREYEKIIRSGRE